MQEMTVPSIVLAGTTYENPTFHLGQYQDGSPALYAMQGGELLCKASVALEVKPAPGCVWIKTWSENEGILPQLEAYGIVGSTPRIHAVNDWGAIAIEAKLLGVFAS